MGDNRLYNMEGTGMILKMLDGIVRELKEVRYVTQFKRNCISVGALKALGLKVSVRDGVLKMTRGSMAVLKVVRRNNLYNLKGSMLTGQVATSINSGGDCNWLRHMRLGHTGENP